MRTRCVVLALSITPLVYGCGATETRTETISTATRTVTVATTVPAPTFTAGSTTDPPAPTRRRPAKPSLVKCDRNIKINHGPEGCGFATNVFYEYYAGLPPLLKAYSYRTQGFVTVVCGINSGHVRCDTEDGASVRFPLSAVRAYTENQAAAYRFTHVTRPQPKPVQETDEDYLPPPAADEPPLATPPPAATPDYTPQPPPTYTPPPAVTIPNYDEGRGDVVICNDGQLSHSGGIQGACSGHGGVSP